MKCVPCEYFARSLLSELSPSAYIPTSPDPFIPEDISPQTYRTPSCLLHLCLRGLQMSRTDLFLVDQTDTTKMIDTLEDTRDIMGESTLDPEPFAFSGVCASPQAGVQRGGGGGH